MGGCPGPSGSSWPGLPPRPDGEQQAPPGQAGQARTETPSCRSLYPSLHSSFCVSLIHHPVSQDCLHHPEKDALQTKAFIPTGRLQGSERTLETLYAAASSGALSPSASMSAHSLCPPCLGTHTAPFWCAKAEHGEIPSGLPLRDSQFRLQPTQAASVSPWDQTEPKGM